MHNSKLLKKVFSVFLTIVMISGLTAFEGIMPVSAAPVAANPAIYRDYNNYSFAERAADMVARMTLTQKLNSTSSSQAIAVPAGNDAAGTLSTGAKVYAWWNEALHGFARTGTAAGNPGTVSNYTSYPITYSIAQSWDQELMWRVAAEAGNEIREGSPGLNLNLNFYSPTVNLSRDPRWGRNTESFGEDPVSSGMMAAQFVNGMQGFEMDGKTLIDPNGYWKMNATIKHYLANNSEFNRLQGVSFMTEQEAREYYSRVYREVIKRSEVASVMSSYNRVHIANPVYSKFSEQPGGINSYTLDTYLRQTFGFKGYVTGDCNSANTPAMGTGTFGTSPTQGATGYSNTGHGWRTLPYNWYGGPNVAAGTATITQALNVAWGIMGGADLECNAGTTTNGKTYVTSPPTGTTGPAGNTVVGSVSTPFGVYTEHAVDVSVVELMEARLRVGEWDDKVNYTDGASGASTGRVSWFDQAKARVQSYGYALPTSTGVISNTAAATMTNARLELSADSAAKSIVLLKNDAVAGVNDGKPLLPIDVPSGNFTVGVYGAQMSNVNLGLYSSSRAANGTAKQVNPFNGIRDALLAKYPGRVTVTNAGTTFNQATAAAFDYIIAVVGDANNLVAEQDDRFNFLLDESGSTQTTLIKNLYGANKKLIVVMITNCPIGQPTAADNLFASMPALLFSAYLGDRPGTAIGRLITGVESPSAKTVGTWYPLSNTGTTATGSNSSNPNTNMSIDGSLNQLKSYRLSPGTDGPWQSPYGAIFAPTTAFTFLGVNTGRTYMYYNGTGNNAIRFPMGYGLSYTSFEYGKMKTFVNGVEQAETGTVNVGPNDTVTVSFDIKNTGPVAGAEIAQFYVKTPADITALSSTASKAQAYAVKRLQDFVKTKVLEPGDSETVTMSVYIPDLAFWSNTNGKYELMQMANPYVLQVGKSSADTFTYAGENYGAQQTREMNIVNAAGWTPKVSVVSFKPNTPVMAQYNVPHMLRFKVGDTINPNPTVCMANDVLYGYINRLYSSATANQFPIPSNITVTYESNRPWVARVDGTSLTAVTGGVATITGTAYDSITDSYAYAEFVVYIEGDAVPVPDTSMASFTFGGDTIATVADIFEYDVHVPGGKSSIETADFAAASIVPAKPGTVNISISLSPSGGAIGDGAPCVATVLLESIEYPGTISKYTINFGHMEISNFYSVNYMGINTYASVRFSDGVTAYNLYQAFFREIDGKMTEVNLTQIPAVPKHGSALLHGAITDEDTYDLTGFVVKAFLWDQDFVPLVPSTSRVE